MVQKHIVISMIAPVAVAGILIMTLFTATANAQQEDNSTGNPQQPVAGCGPGTDNSTCSTIPNTQAPAAPTIAGCGPGTDNSTCSTIPSLQPTNMTNPTNNTGNVSSDLVNTILSMHNSERAAVGVPALVWNDKLAAGAKAWAEHLATTGEFAHSTCCGAFRDYGENLAGYIVGVGQGVQLWIDEKNHYNGGPLPPDTPASGPQAIGHYTQMVWRTTTSVGCGTASGSGHPFSILVCQYSPPGNIFGQKPY
jgi:uncharacterized protein YkwD